MEESDIKEIRNLLKQSLKLEDWSYVEEAIDYLNDFCETDILEEEEEE